MARITLIGIRMAAVASFLLAGVCFAQGSKSADDAIADELSKAKDAYRTAVEKAGDALNDSFDKEIKRLEASTRLKIDVQIKLIEQLQAEKKAFQAAKSLPSSDGMKEAVSQYKIAMKTAQSRCEKAFDTAAEKYRGKKDLIAAKAVLEAKQEFVSDVSLFSFEGVWLSRNDATKWTGKRTARTDSVLDFNGDVCKWKKEGGQITVTWPNGYWEKLDIDFKNPNQLNGKNSQGATMTWARQK